MLGSKHNRWILLVAVGCSLGMAAWWYAASRKDDNLQDVPRIKGPDASLANRHDKRVKSGSDAQYDLGYALDQDKNKSTELKGQELFMARQMLGMEAMQKLNSEDFAAFLEAIEPGPLLDYLTVNFARHLATNDFAFGKSWLLGLEADQLAAQAGSMFFHHLKSEQLEDAAKMIGDFRSPVIRRQIADAAVRSAAKFGLAEAQKLIGLLESNPEFKVDIDRFTVATATGLVSAQKFADGADLLLSLKSKTGKISGTTGQAVENLARNWAISDPGAASEWAGEVKDSDVALIAVPSIISCWVATDTIKASEWLNALPPSPAKDRGITQLIKALEVSQPESATIWANAISDPNLRTATQQSLRK
jgi:hypothetical protein